MPTTPNHGWPTPADTDYVKDGAAAIRSLGDAVDATLAALKVESLETAVLDNGLVLKPDGAGGVAFGSNPGGIARLGSVRDVTYRSGIGATWTTIAEVAVATGGGHVTLMGSAKLAKSTSAGNVRLRFFDVTAGVVVPGTGSTDAIWTLALNDYLEAVAWAFHTPGAAGARTYRLQAYADAGTVVVSQSAQLLVMEG